MQKGKKESGARKIDKWSILDNVLTYGLIFCILLLFMAWAIAYLPHYEKKVYEQTIPITREDVEEERKKQEQEGDEFLPICFAGYPTSGMSSEVSTLEALEELSDNLVCLEVDVEDLEPTGFYNKTLQFSQEGGVSSRYSYKQTYTGSRFNLGPEYTDNYINTLRYRSKAIYSQYYALTLPDGNKVLILLNDTAIDIPKSGKIQLPAASWSWLMLGDEEKTKELGREFHIKMNNSNDIHYLDAASSWMLFHTEIEKACEERDKLWVCLLLVAVLGIFAAYGTVFALNKFID